MIKTFGKGLLMGAADAVPGVSGGTIAFVTGIYDRLIRLVAGLGPELLLIWRRDGFSAVLAQLDLRFSIPLLAGIITGMLLISGSVLWALDQFPAFIWSAFLGLVLMAVPILLREADPQQHWPWLTLGFVVTASLGWLSVSFPISMIGIAAGGFIALSAMILPGISGSFLLLLFGLYPTVFGGLHERDLSVIVPFALGGIAGLMLMTRVLRRAFDRYPSQIRLLLGGLMLGSAFQLWPFQYTSFDVLNGVYALVGLVFGGAALWLVDHLARR